MPLSGSAFWGVLLPVEKTNLLSNPSFERGTAGWGTVNAGTIGTTSAFQQYGAWSGSVAPTSNTTCGVSFTTGFTLGNGTNYTLSASVKGQAGVAYAMGIADTSDTILNGTSFTGGGTWHRYSIAHAENTGATRRVVIRKNLDADTNAFYIDGVQVEVGSQTTYIDGDQDGCYWLGDTHASQSVRSGTYRGGGSIVALADLGLKPNEHPGIGMPPQEVTAQSFALQAGAEYQRSRAGERPFTLTFQPIAGTTMKDFHATRRTIIDALKPDLISPQQPVRFWYTGGQGTVQIDAVYAGGLDLGELDGPMAEDGAVKFVAHDPYWYATTQQGTALAGRANIGSANFLAWRDPLGRWGTTGSAGTTIELNSGGQLIRDLLYASGTLFVCGNFGTVAGTVGVLHVAQYRPANNTWGSMHNGTVAGAVNGCYALARSPAGTLFVGGDFSGAVGTRSPGIAQWNGAWGSLTTGTIDPPVTVRDLLYSPTGTLFAAGNWITVRGTTAPLVVQWTGAAWGSLGEGTLHTQVNNSAFALAWLNNSLIVGGNFTQANSTQSVSVARWSGGSWGTLGLGMLSPVGTLVAALAVGADQTLYAGGLFGSAGGGSAQNIAQWNGVQWFRMADGLGTYAGGIYDLRTLPDGEIFIGGRNLTGPNSGAILPDDMAQWNGYTFLPLDVNLGAGNSGTLHATTDPGGTLWVAGGFSGTATAASVAQVYNTGRTDSQPVLVVRNTSAGTARVYQLLNTTTGDSVFFNLALLPSETMTFDTAARTLQTDFRGNVFSAIRPGSNLASFRLQSGTNFISFFSDSGSVTTSLYWRPRHWSADGGTVV